MAERKLRMALLSRYSKLYTQKYESKPDINMYKEQWAADALVESYGLPDCLDLLAYYFEVSNAPTWQYFCYNADKIVESRKAMEQDQKERTERRKLAREWLNG